MKPLLPVLLVAVAAAWVSSGSEQPEEQGRSISRTSVRVDHCPPSWPGPWTACPEAAWVRRIAETAGYRIVGETGSALVAGGRGDSFFIWATPMTGKHFAATARRQDWRRRGRVGGVHIFGEGTWRWWRAQGFVFWLHAGPRADATLPTLAELPSLVRASLELPPPGSPRAER